MSYSQSPPYPPYQQTSYDNQQQPSWNSETFPPTTAPFENFSQFPRGPVGSYDDATLLPTNEQSAPSPNYSQYLNFDPMDSGPAAGPGEAISSQPLYNTSPISTISPQQFLNFPIKTEPETERHSLPLPQGLNMGQTTDSFPQTCGSAPACLRILENPDMEMEDFNLGEWFPADTTSNLEKEPARRPSHTISGTIEGGRKSSADDGTSTTRKPRKRGRKPSAADDEDAQARAKQAHSIVERRYRDNLNGKIMQLHRTLSSIAANPSRLDTSSSAIADDAQEQRPMATRVRKSDVMTDAVNYVHQSEVQMRHMEDEILRLTERVRTLEKLVRCEDCVLLKEMVRRSLQGHKQPAQ